MAVSTIKLLESFVDYCSIKNKVISENIANTETQNYQRKDVMFKNLLSESMNGALKTSEENHFSSSDIENGDNPDFEIVNIKNSGNDAGINNNVDIDKEMAELAKNSMNFAFASKKISDYYKTLQDVIKGGSAQ